jgi:hypothetical protein
MKTTLKALALVAALISSSAFAANGTDYATDLTVTGVDIAGTEAAAAFATYTLSAGVGSDSYSSDVALIEQLGGDSNIAVIDQSTTGAPGNFAAISQSGQQTTAVAFIGQAAATNSFAYIKQ